LVPSVVVSSPKVAKGFGVPGIRCHSPLRAPLAHGKTRSALESSKGGKANPRFLAAVLLRVK
jgi:hypothetical protein